jgi:hypothetical protein
VTGSDFTPLYRLIVAITWQDKYCTPECQYLTTTLISSKTSEPVFSVRDSISRVKITSVPGTQTNDVSTPLSLAFTADGSQVTWKASGMPAGLVIDAATGTISGSPTATGTVSVTVTATDAYAQEDYVTFSWVIKALPTMTAPGNLTTPGGVAWTKTFAATNGTTPYTWSWSATPTAAWSTGLPPGITLDPSTGTASGTPTIAGTNTVTVTVTDKYNQSNAKSFTWTVAALAVSTFTVPTSKLGTAITPVTMAATGGVQPYVSWSASALPNGLSINSTTGQISGTPILVGTYSTVITVTDSSALSTARTATRTVTWKVTP